MSHAVLSPSAASRWMACTPSARLEQKFKDPKSPYAMEGTLAHNICEAILLNDHGQLDDPKFKKKMATYRKNEFYNEEMLDYCQGYVDYVSAQVTEGAYIFVEQKLDMTNFIPEGFGTADAIVIKDGLLRFNDLKYGKGVPVHAPNNPQLMIYALGALNDFGHIFEIDRVEMTIYQPRLDNISVWEISADELVAWGENSLQEKAELAFKGEGEFVPGNHCGFCKAKAQCRALHDHNMKMAKETFPDPELMTDEELLLVHSGKKLFDTWINAVSDYLLDKALNGAEFEGYKLVEGRSNRQYADAEALEINLIEKGFKDKIYKEPALVGLTEMTKRLGKPKFEELVEPFLIKPPGKPALVPEDDKRPALSKAKDVFDDL